MLLGLKDAKIKKLDIYYQDKHAITEKVSVLLQRYNVMKDCLEVVRKFWLRIKKQNNK